MTDAPGSKDGPRPLFLQLVLGATVCFVLLGIAGALSLQALRAARVSHQELEKTQRVLEAVTELQRRHAQLIADLRAYVLTGQRGYREAFDTGGPQLRAQMDALASLQPEPEQARRLAELGAELEIRERQFQRALEIYASGGTPAVQAMVADPELTRSAQHVEALLAALSGYERARLAGHVREDRERQDRIGAMLGALLGIAALAVAWLTWRVVRELRARTAAERQLLWERRFAEQIIENLPTILYLKDADTLRLTRINRATERLFGRSREELLGRDVRAFFPPDYAEWYMARERALVDGSRRGGESEEREEVPLDTPQGRRVVAVRKVVVKDDQGRPAYLLGSAVDVTERRLAEQQLREFSEQLGEKTRALEAANRELEGFSYSVSHDLRAPLRAIDGFAAMLEEDYGPRFDDEGRRYLRTIREGASRMGQLIQDLLDFSRLNRHSMSIAVIDAEELVRSAWNRLTPRPAAQLDIGPLPALRGDPQLLLQVWLNLLDNAVKYSSRRPDPRIRVSGRVEGAESVFEVDDNGAGFDMRYYDKLFQVFQRLHGESEYPGTGVGLAIVQRIVNRHGGRVWAEGRPGEGATFGFALPLH